MKKSYWIESCRRTVAPILATVLLAGLCTTVAQAQQQQGFIAQDARIVGDAGTMNLNGVTAGDIVSLDLPANIPADWTIDIPSTAWKSTEISLTLTSIRSPEYVLQHQLADGSVVQMPAPSVRTYQGNIRGAEGTAARGSLLGLGASRGLIASIWQADGTRLVVQPLSDFIPGAAPNLHVVYRGEDTSCIGMCGNDPQQGNQQPVDPFAERGSCGGSVCIADLGLDIDSTYVATANGGNGSATTALDRAEAVVNVMNHQYTTELNIAHRISFTIIRVAGSDIYTTSNINTLLNTLRSDWNANRPGTTRDMAHLFTGQPTGGTIGLAFVGVVCQSQSSGSAYGVSQVSWTGAFACQTDLVAHELGHNWNANHCTCPSSTMNPSITCINTFTNSASPNSISDIDAFRDGRACLTSGGTVPANNNCGSAITITASVTTGTTVGSTTDGGVTGCSTLGGAAGGGENDVWYNFTAAATGSVTAATCGSAFDTMLSVHSNSCPGTPGTSIVCNDDFCGVQSSVTFAATQGTTYKIRVSGFGGATGAFTLTLSGPGTVGFGSNACSSATAVTDGSYTGSIFNATNDAAGTCGSTTTARDVWFSYTAGCAGTLSVNTCGSNDWNGIQDSGMDSVVSLYSTCGGTAIICNDDSVIAGCTQNGNIRDSLVSTPVVAGQTVLIRVASFADFYYNGMFRLNVSGPICPPANDLCTNATRILQDGTYTATTNSGTGQEGASTCEFAPAGDVYWLFTSPTTGTANINTCGSSFDTVLSIHSACPATTSNLVTCNDQSALCSNVNNSAVSFSAVQGQTYLVRVVGWNGQLGNIVLNVDAPARASADNCAAPTFLPDGLDVIGSLYDNTASSSSDSCGGPGTSRDAWYRYNSPTPGTLTVTTCGSRNFVSNGVSGVDTVVSLFDACAAGQITCNDQFGGACATSSVFDSTVSIAYAGNVNVFIRVAHYGFGNVAEWYGNGMFRVRASVGNTCNDIDFNNDGSSFDPQDIDAFLSRFSEGPCIPGSATCDSIDFNNDGSIFDPCDIDSFLLVFGEGPCTPCGL